MVEKQLLQIHGLGDQLRNMALDPSSGFFYDGTVVRPVVAEVIEPPIFSEVEKTCATRGVAQIVHFPRHLQRG